MKPILLLMIILLLSGCADVLVKEEMPLVPLEPAMKNVKKDLSLPYVYQGALPDDKYSLSIKYPVINLNTEYGTISNQMIQLFLTRAIDLYEKSLEETLLDYEVFDNGNFTSLILSLEIEEGGKEVFVFNFYHDTGEGLNIDDLDREANFNNTLKSLVEEMCVSINAPYEKEGLSSHAAGTLIEFWDLKKKGFPQIYMKEGKIFGNFSFYNKDGGKYSKLLPIDEKNAEALPGNPLFLKFGGTKENEFIIASLDWTNDFNKIIENVREKLLDVGYKEEINLIGTLEEGRELYVIIPKYKNTVLRYYTENNPQGILNLSQVYLVAVSPVGKSPELVFRKDLILISGMNEKKMRVVDITDIFD